MRISGQPANLLATAPIGKMMAKFAVLAIISNLITSVFNIVDQIFIGQNLGILGITGLSGMTVPIQKGYAATSLMNLPPLPIFAYCPQDIANPSVYRWIAYSSGLSIANAFKAHSEHGVVFNLSSALLQSIRKK